MKSTICTGSGQWTIEPKPHTPYIRVTFKRWGVVEVDDYVTAEQAGLLSLGLSYAEADKSMAKFVEPGAAGVAAIEAREASAAAS